MSNVTIIVLRVVIALSLIGSVLVQTVIAPLLWVDLAGEELWGRILLITVLVLGVATMQVFAVCVWMLLTRVRRGSIFSASSFRFVNVIIGAIAAAAVLAFVLAVALAPGGTAPGIVGLVCGASLVLGGMALLVVVMKALLRQAIDRDSEAQALRSELDDEVI